MAESQFGTLTLFSYYKLQGLMFRKVYPKGFYARQAIIPGHYIHSIIKIFFLQ